MVSVHRWRFQVLTAVSFFVNVVVMIHLRNSAQISPASIAREDALSRLTRDTPATQEEKSVESVAVGDSGCQRSVVFLGIRKHWFIFCAYEEFSQYRYMIQFPRTVSCPEVGCNVMVNYTEEPLDIRGYDIVIITDVEPWMTPEMWGWAHGNRTDGQIWTMITEESPLYVPGVQPPKKYAATSFDWVDSYRGDSDFVHPYGSYEEFSGLNRPPPIDLTRFVTGKTRMIAWMGSHCETMQWDRLKFVRSLNKTLGRKHVDTYGRCGALGEIPWNNDTIIQETIGSYRFYLSLENSCCEEYITEKFWRALEMGLVPVVVGAPLEHYTKFAPPNSFIHVDSFDSIKDLAIELLSLHTDDEAYLKYHRWRNEGRLVSYGQEEQYVRPLNNQTQCALLGKLLKTRDVPPQAKLDFYGPRWYGSCRSCGSKAWIQEFMHPKNHARKHTDIWA